MLLIVVQFVLKLLEKLFVPPNQQFKNSNTYFSENSDYFLNINFNQIKKKPSNLLFIFINKIYDMLLQHGFVAKHIIFIYLLVYNTL